MSRGAAEQVASSGVIKSCWGEANWKSLNCKFWDKRLFFLFHCFSAFDVLPNVNLCFKQVRPSHWIYAGVFLSRVLFTSVASWVLAQKLHWAVVLKVECVTFLGMSGIEGNLPDSAFCI